MLSQFFNLLAQAGAKQGVAAAPFLPTQGGEIYSHRIHDADHGLGHAISAGEEGSHTAHEVEYLGSLLAFQPFWNALQVLAPD